jgi:hypothetical protein
MAQPRANPLDKFPNKLPGSGFNFAGAYPAGVMSRAQIWNAGLRDSYGVVRRDANQAIRGRPNSTETHAEPMSREFTIGARRFLIVSEPQDKGWKAQVLEVIDEIGGTEAIGIETTGETRGMADDRAIGQLQHRLQDQSL